MNGYAGWTSVRSQLEPSTLEGWAAQLLRFKSTTGRQQFKTEKIAIVERRLCLFAEFLSLNLFGSNW
jgi:hypothetical protein